jgi:hypothetical protein
MARMAYVALLPNRLAQLLAQLLTKLLRNLRLLDIGCRDRVNPIERVGAQSRREPELWTDLRALLSNGR